MTQKPLSTTAAERMNLVAQDEICSCSCWDQCTMFGAPQLLEGEEEPHTPKPKIELPSHFRVRPVSPMDKYIKDTGVGKSSIVWRFVEDSFDPNINPTIGASFMTKTVQYQNELHKFLIWDTAGQERFRALAPMYYRGSAAAIIVYDITKEETFSTLKNWVRELRQHGPPSIVVAIAGNKCDLTDVREVMERDAKDYADSIHAIFVETSAKNAININELFIEISRRIPSTDANPPSGGKGFKLRRQPSEPKRSCC
ncbi:Ras-related protein Rab-22A [Cricetulus griseus]|uniref:Ras-related protein Rab-22A n=1 Tax=Cricetulus griseus TaxID=10029 RepID=G3GWU6_CRIGR|nr:Ras-related protein Rab-22A [Cricetulus griseus]